MDVIYSALFEGDTTRQLPKDNIFPCPDFWFFNFFFDFFKYLKTLKKNQITLKLRTGRRRVSNGKTNEFQAVEHTYAQCKDTCVG